MYQTIHENGGWDNWRFIIIDEVTCTKYQIHNICENYRKKESSFKNDNLVNTEKKFGTLLNYSFTDTIKDNKEHIKEVKVANLDNSTMQENTRKYKKIQENIKTGAIIQENIKENTSK